MEKSEKVGSVHVSPSGTESKLETGERGPEGPLKRQLKNRHISMISIGGVIGTGLFLGTATALRNGGPVGLLLGFTAMGTICYTITVSLGEMVAYLPIAGGHITLAERFVNPALSFAMGWNYWYNWSIVLPAELSAASVLIGYWIGPDEVNPAVWITVCMVIVVLINVLGAGAYGEAEFIFASIKIITIICLIILGLIIDLGGAPSRDRLGFRYWKDPGAFAQYAGIEGAKGRFLAWFSVIVQAAFSFIGTEIVAVTAAEAQNPRYSIPRAIKRVYIRILLFYILGTFVIGLICPANDPGLNLADGTAASSPFVIAIRNAGISGLPSVVNAAILTSAWSAASSNLYTSSRALYGLAKVGNAPRIFLRTSKHGLPYVSVAVCSLFSGLAYLAISEGSGVVFNALANTIAIAGLITWFGIGITYIRFYQGLKAHGIDRAKLPYAAKFQPYLAIYATCFTFLICLLCGWSVFLKNNWNTTFFVTNYLPLALFPFLYFGAKFFYRKKPTVRPEDMDFVSDLDEIEAAR
ncbi:amino acid transporter [Coprinopsis sp. MPI-PUGE-AT-0042]|nr:amino acid transporter [Coprinopsis sp. MPI-PUGE-AT-0042]